MSLPLLRVQERKHSFALTAELELEPGFRLPSPPQSPRVNTTYPASGGPSSTLDAVSGSSRATSTPSSSTLNSLESRVASSVDVKRKLGPSSKDSGGPARTTKKPRIYTEEDERARRVLIEKTAKIEELKRNAKSHRLSCDAELSRLRSCLKMELEKVEQQQKHARELEDELEEKENELDTSKIEIASLTSRVEDAEAKMHEYRRQKEALNVDTKRFASEMRTQKQQLKEQVQDLKKRARHYEEQCDAWERRYRNLQSSMSPQIPIRDSRPAAR
ncbi:hypothetical protein MKEN_00802100 [Mycena kentingensis (nom. inval.)]|nr:hypothetical protein MKEN_00802100 [Mycena kentingensis (nom. inval.)]